MQRVRMSLPYYKDYGWEAEVICVNEEYIEGFRDPILSATLPSDLVVHKTKAFSTKITRKFGLGSLSIRAFLHIMRKGNSLLSEGNFDLVFFSTTAFHVCWLGRYWKKKFKLPFVIDLQDPWRNDYYNDKPKHLRPPKHAVFYQLHKYLEAQTMPLVDGIMSVSNGYLQMMEDRYGLISKNVPAKMIPFGASKIDFDLIETISNSTIPIQFNKQTINVLYVGAVTSFFLPIIEAFFKAYIKYESAEKNHHFYFIGTSYATQSEKKVKELATRLGLSHIVTEETNRLPYFQALSLLKKADILFVPGSMDVDYNASKIYNNILAETPIFSIFNQRSEVKNIVEASNAGIVVPLEGSETVTDLEEKIAARMKDFFGLEKISRSYSKEAIRSFSAETRVSEQANLFEQALVYFKNVKFS